MTTRNEPIPAAGMTRIEYAFIGTLLMDPSLIAMHPVKADHFENKLCSKIYQQLLRGNTDPALICREMGNSVEPELAKMINESFPSAVAKYAKKIIQAYRRRRACYALDIARKKISSGDDLDNVFNDLIAAVDNGQESEFRLASDLAYAVYNDMQRREDGSSGSRAIASGYSTIDAFTGGLERGNLITIAARPSMGKSALAIGMALNVSKTATVCIASLEMDASSVAYRLIARLSSLDLKLLRTSSGFSSTAWRKSADAVDQISALQLWVDDNPYRTAEQISAHARRHHARHGLDLLIVDYLGLLNQEGHKPLPRHLQVAEMTRMLKATAKQLDCSVVILCQLNREADGQRPTLAHLRESGAIEQDSDIVLFPYRYRDGKDDKAEVIVAKNRNGPIGIAPMRWEATTASFDSQE